MGETVQTSQQNKTRQDSTRQDKTKRSTGHIDTSPHLLLDRLQQGDEGVGWGVGCCPDMPIHEKTKTQDSTRQYSTRQDKTNQNDPQATETHRPTSCLTNSSRAIKGLGGGWGGCCPDMPIQYKTIQYTTKQDGPQQATERQTLTCCLTDSSRATEGVRNSVRKRPTLPAKCRSSSWRA